MTAAVSIFRTVKATTNVMMGLDMIMHDIRDGQWKDQIEECRAILASKGKDEADKYKKERLPCVTFSGVFCGPHRAENLTVHSGILCLDFDDLGDGLDEAWTKLARDPYCRGMFRSPCNGIKFLMEIQLPACHTRTFNAAVTYFEKTYGLKVDPSGKDVCRLCFMSYDPQLIYNPNSAVFQIPPAEKTPPAQGSDDHPDRAKVEDALRHISADCPYAVWIDILMALHSWSPSEGRALADSWSRTAPERYQEGLIDEKWKSFKPGAVTVATLFKMAIDNGWKPQKIQKQTATKQADGRTVTSPDNGRKGGRPSAPPSSEIAFQFAEENLKTPDGHLAVRHYRDQWYRFAEGWFPVTEIEMEKRVITFLQDDPALVTFATNFYARNILRNLASFNLCGLDARIEMPCWLSTGEDARNWIAFSNITLNVWKYASELAEGRVPTDYTRPVSPDLFSADFVSYPWDESAVPKKFLTYLERVQPDIKNFDAIRRMMGLLLADVQKYEVFFQLNGLGANGKTVLLDIVEALVGFLNVCRVSLESLQPGSRFQTWPLAVSKVNICGEIATDVGSGALAAIEGVFKHCVSGGVIEVEHKGVDKITARCRARFVLSGNSLPTFVDKSNAIWRRLRIIPFTVDLPTAEQDVDLAKKIIRDELPGIALWAIDGLAEVLRDGRVPDCPAGERQKDQHRADCDHERMFLLEQFETGEDEDRLPSERVYSDYRGWMFQNGYKPLGSGKFFARLEVVFPCSEAKVLKIDGGSVRGVTRLRQRQNG